MKKFSTIVIVLFTSVLFLPAFGQWVRHTLDENLSQPASMISGDIDGDGDFDIAATIFGNNDLVWYEKDGLEWTKHMIDSAMGGVGVIISDIDGDAMPDITVAAWGLNKVKWYKNGGGSPITWTPFTIDESLSGAEFVTVGDIDRDGDADVAATSYTAGLLVWYENDGGEPVSWTKHMMDSNLEGAGYCGLADLDGDDTLDVIATGFDASVLAWYKSENAGQEWTKYTVDGGLAFPAEASVIDIDGDGDPDMFATGRNVNQVVWYENTEGTPITWIKHVIDNKLVGAFEVAVADVDLNGTQDVFASAYVANDLVWYSNDGGSPPTWTKHGIESELVDAWCVISCDMNGDNFPDLIANQWLGDASIVWYENPLLGVGIPHSIPDGTCQIYPNPVENNLFIESGMPGPLHLEINSLNGKILLSRETEGADCQLDLSSFRAGLYILTIRSRDHITTRKIIKM